MSALYDTVGVNYSNLRLPDPRLAAPILEALGEAKTVLNVGAGAGSYEPADRHVTALEPSLEMIRQRAPHGAPVIQGLAEALPFTDESFDAAMAVLTVHHWADQRRGLAEMRRVARGPVVILTFDRDVRPWLTDYLPALAELDLVQMPAMDEYEEALGPVRIDPVPIPFDCSDGFLYAYWRRPSAYLDERLRAGSSSFWALDDTAEGLARLARDLKTGAWERRYADLLQRDELDLGYRLVVTLPR